MIIVFETSSDSNLEALKVAGAPTEVRIIRGDLPADATDIEENVISVYTGLPSPTGDVATDRYTHLRLASEGVRYWGESLEEESVLFAGNPKGIGFSFQHLIDDALYTLSRKQYIQSFGVKYTGRLFASPKTFIILDAKRSINEHDPMENPKLGNLLESLPEDLWNTTALVSASSAKRLESLLDEHDQTIPVTTSTGTRSKITFMGLPVVETHMPSDPSKEFGISLRSSVTMFERDY